MTTAQLDHMLDVSKEASRLIRAKYSKGVAEHGTFLMDLTADELLENAIDEAVDQLVYLLSLKEKLDERRFR